MTFYIDLEKIDVDEVEQYREDQERYAQEVCVEIEEKSNESVINVPIF